MAVRIFGDIFRDQQPDTHAYAMAAMCLAKAYRQAGDTVRQERYLMEAATTDIRLAVKENEALLALAMRLFEAGDIDRAYSYISFALSDANFYNSRFKNTMIARLYPIIESCYLDKLATQRRNLRLFGIVSSLLALGCAIALFFYFRQTRIVSQARSRLKRLTEELLHLNKSLDEANVVKERYLGYFMNPANRLMSSLLLGCGLPGGMMGSMMADLAGVMSAINNNRKAKGEEPLSEDALLVKLFNEVAYVWPRVGYPPLVTPFSQYVKNIALMNLLTESMDKPRYTMMDNSIWGMILGKSGKLPGPVAPEIVELAKEKGLEFTDADPQSYYPDDLDRFVKEMEENGWERGEDDEELFEFAMHETQYRDYKSGAAKKRFLADLQAAKDKAQAGNMTPEQAAAFKHAKADALVAPESGTVLWEINGDGECVKSIEPFIGKQYQEGDFFCYIENTHGQIVEVPAALGGKLVEINAKQGAHVAKGDVIAYIERA